jgi:L-ascorbate metabolism protein UlaG (beta-lactamase superfamily)
MVTITYHGHSCIELNDGKFNILFDPFITNNPVSTAKWENLKPDVILLSHGHVDHVGDAIPIAKKTGALIIAPFELANFCSLRGAPNTHPMHIGGSRQFDFGKLKLTQAWHGSAFIDGDKSHYTGNPCGYLLTMSGKTFYFAGDTGLFGDMKTIGALNTIDLSFLPIGDNFTMGPKDAVIAAQWLDTKTVIPIHYNTWPVIAQNPEDFKKMVEEAGIRCVVIPFNQSVTME